MIHINWTITRLLSSHLSYVTNYYKTMVLWHFMKIKIISKCIKLNSLGVTSNVHSYKEICLCWPKPTWLKSRQDFTWINCELCKRISTQVLIFCCVHEVHSQSFWSLWQVHSQSLWSLWQVHSQSFWSLRHWTPKFNRINQLSLRHVRKYKCQKSKC